MGKPSSQPIRIPGATKSEPSCLSMYSNTPPEHYADRFGDQLVLYYQVSEGKDARHKRYPVRKYVLNKHRELVHTKEMYLNATQRKKLFCLLQPGDYRLYPSTRMDKLPLLELDELLKILC